MDARLNELAKLRAEALGFSTFSAYVVQLIRQDLAQRGELHLREEPVIFGENQNTKRNP